MTSSDPKNGTPLLEEINTMQDPQDWLLRSAVWIILGLFGVTVLLNLLAVATLGFPEDESRHSLASLFDPVYQSFVLMLVVMVLLVRSFFRQLHETTRRLIGQEVIVETEEAKAPNFVQTWHLLQDLRNPARFLTGAIFMAAAAALIFYVIYEQDLSGLLPGHKMPPPLEAYSTVIYITRLLYSAGILAALYAVGNWMFMLFQTGKLFRRLPNFFDLKIQPAHPDRCGGFKAAGDLYLKMVYVILAPAVFFSFWLIVSKSLALNPTLQDIFPPYLAWPGFRTPLKIILGMLVISGMLIFVWPALTLHTFLMEERAELEKDLAGIASRIRLLNREVLDDPAYKSIDDRDQLLAEIDSLQDLYAHIRKAPTWPFDRRITVKFVSTQVIPVLSLLGLGEPLARLVEIMAALFRNS